MGHLNLPPSKQRSPRQWRLLDVVTAALFGLVILFFVGVYTPLGDSLAASGQQTLMKSDPMQRSRIIAAAERGLSGGDAASEVIEACTESDADHMPCEDPRRNSQLSRDMNFYRERHCPVPQETPLCLIPPPDGYEVPVPWPQSLHKVGFSLSLSLCRYVNCGEFGCECDQLLRYQDVINSLKVTSNRRLLHRILHFWSLDFVRVRLS